MALERLRRVYGHTGDVILIQNTTKAFHLCRKAILVFRPKAHHAQAGRPPTARSLAPAGLPPPALPAPHENGAATGAAALWYAYQS